MLFRFSEVKLLPNGYYDYDNAEFLGAIEHKDYVQYLDFLHYLIAHPNLSAEEEWNNLTCVQTQLSDDGEEHMRINNEPYTIMGVSYTVPFDNINLEHIDVYVTTAY